LVDLEEEGVAGLGLDGFLDELGVGDCQVVADNLKLGAGLLVVVGPGFPVVFGKGVFDRGDGVLGGEVVVLLGELLVGDPLGLVGVGVL
jgi:hypothetical protein